MSRAWQWRCSYLYRWDEELQHGYMEVGALELLMLLTLIGKRQGIDLPDCPSVVKERKANL